VRAWWTSSWRGSPSRRIHCCPSPARAVC
jgi:hypothetical protein